MERHTPSDYRFTMILKTKEFNSEETRHRYADLFFRHGIAPDRVDLIGGTPHREHLDYYSRIDIALDPFPFSGSTTTLESLWMGVPVITMPGETFASRHSLSFLSTVGLTETIADTPDRYVALAEKLAGDLPHLSEIRSSLRDRFRASPLCDGGPLPGGSCCLRRPAGGPIRSKMRLPQVLREARFSFMLGKAMLKFSGK